MLVDLITIPTLNITCFFKFQTNILNIIPIYNGLSTRKIMFGDYTVTTCNFFVIIIHYINAVLIPIVVVSFVGFNHQLQKVTDQKDSILGPDHLNHQKNCFIAQRKAHQ